MYQFVVVMVVYTPVTFLSRAHSAGARGWARRMFFLLKKRFFGSFVYSNVLEKIRKCKFHFVQHAEIGWLSIHESNDRLLNNLEFCARRTVSEELITLRHRQNIASLTKLLGTIQYSHRRLLCSFILSLKLSRQPREVAIDVILKWCRSTLRRDSFSFFNAKDFRRTWRPAEKTLMTLVAGSVAWYNRARVMQRNPFMMRIKEK